jgi:ABC-type amino acid transport substrate-binding protein
MVKNGNPSHISDLASLSGKTVAVEAATTEKDALDAENKILAKSVNK